MRGLTPLRQLATWSYLVSNDGYQDIYEEEVIRCRYVPQQKLILQVDGSYRQASAKLIVANDVKGGDRVEFNAKSSVVLATKDRIGLGGGTIEREIWV